MRSSWRSSFRLPDRWLNYRPVGKRLPGTRFVAFKVPLTMSLTRNLPDPDVFGLLELVNSMRRQKEELGMIIDLTNTTRYYGLQDIPDYLTYMKIFTAGHAVPSDEVILSFKRAVYKFIRDNEDNDNLIGVHCTHGVNRTGYLICRYLIDVNGMDPHATVKLFNSARGYDIERDNYLYDLLNGPRRSNDGIERCELLPQRGQASNLQLGVGENEDDPSNLGYNWFNPEHHRPSPPAPHQRPLHPSQNYPRLPPPAASVFPIDWSTPFGESYVRRPSEARRFRRHWETERDHADRSSYHRYDHYARSGYAPIWPPGSRDEGGRRYREQRRNERWNDHKF